jgi:acetyl esterase/lipase
VKRALAAILAGALCLAAAPAPKLMGWQDLLDRPLPHPDAKIAYGPSPEQFAELWLPKGRGPFPVALMIHGGCWRSDVASLSIMNYAADDLRKRGVAVWNVEYRGVDRPGGGYPGTYQDVAAAAHALAREAPARGLDLDRLAYVGHSAGGHLAVWLAGADKIAAGPLAHTQAPPPREVVILGGLPDLASAAQGCGDQAVAAMTGAGAGRPDPLADTSGAALLPLGVQQVVASGELDGVSTMKMNDAWESKSRAAGDAVLRIVALKVGHVEEITPEAQAWKLPATQVANALGAVRTDAANPPSPRGPAAK